MIDKIDVMLYMMPPQAFVTTMHLAAKEHPIYQDWHPGELWHIKGSRGFPWDGNVYDEEYIYQLYTEGRNGWEDPSSFKKFVSKSWPNGKGGIAWCPRYLPKQPLFGEVSLRIAPHFIITPDSSYQIWENGKLIATQQLGVVQCQMSGPHVIDCGGDIGWHQCLVQTYQWDPNFLHMEENWYGLGLGWVRWRLWRMRDGIYWLVQETSFNKLTPGGTPALVPPSD